MINDKCDCGADGKYLVHQHWWYDEYDDYEHDGYVCSWKCFLKYPFEPHNGEKYCGVLITNENTGKQFMNSTDGVDELEAVFWEDWFA